MADEVSERGAGLVPHALLTSEAVRNLDDDRARRWLKETLTALADETGVVVMSASDFYRIDRVLRHCNEMLRHARKAIDNGWT